MGLLREALGKGNGKPRGLQPGICRASRRALPCTHVASAAPTLAGAASLLRERPCRLAARLGARQPALASGLLHGGCWRCCLRASGRAAAPAWSGMVSSSPPPKPAVLALQPELSFLLLKLRCLGVDTGG